MEDFYYTTKEENQAEFVEKHSRFIGYCKPISTEQEAIDFINESVRNIMMLLIMFMHIA